MEASIVHLCTRKWNRQSCGYHRRIPIIVIPGKILARIFFNRWPLPRKWVWLLEGLWNCQHDAVCYTATPGRVSTTELKFLHNVCRPDKGLWHRLLLGSVENRGNFGCPDKFNSIVRHFHDDMLALKHFQSPTDSSKAVSLPPHC